LIIINPQSALKLIAGFVIALAFFSLLAQLIFAKGTQQF